MTTATDMIKDLRCYALKCFESATEYTTPTPHEQRTMLMLIVTRLLLKSGHI